MTITKDRITKQQRFTRVGNTCPICDGYDSSPEGERCWGFFSSDGKYATCTRPEYAGGLEINGSGGYTHLLQGECKCGVQHGVKMKPYLADKGQPGTDKKTARASQQENDSFTYEDARATAKYHYRDASNKIVYTVVRYQWPDKSVPGAYKKTFRPFHWVGQEPAFGGVPEEERILYNLPALLAAPKDQPVYIPEGEKDVDTLSKLGLLAVCNVGGAAKSEDAKQWLPQYSTALAGRHIVLLPDNDTSGQEHIKTLKKSLVGKAASIQVVTLPELPEKGDVSDFVANGGTRSQLEALVKQPRKSKFTYASEVETKPIDWLWKKRIAMGMMTVMVGDPGLGKSTITNKIIAAVTTGGMLPDNITIAPGGVILMSPEDSAEHTIVPRLKAVGADLSKIILLTTVTDYDSEGNEVQRPISFPKDAHVLEEAIKECGAALAVIDPVLNMIDRKYDSHKDQDVREVLGRVVSVAEQHNCAVLGIMHINKSQSSNALHRSGGSIAFMGVARVGMYVVHDPDNPEGGVIVNHKNNLANKEKTASIRYAFHENEHEIGYISWEGESNYTQEQLLNQGSPTNNPTSQQEENILEVLKKHEQAMTVAQIYAELTTGQNIDTLQKMLTRKVEQGICIRPTRGLYTYAGNPFYSPSAATEQPKKEHVGNVGNVRMSEMSESPKYERDIKSFGHEKSDVRNNLPLTVAYEASSEQTDISDIGFGVGFNVGNEKNTTNPPIELMEEARGYYQKLRNELEAMRKKKAGDIMWFATGQNMYPETGMIPINEYAQRMLALLQSNNTQNVRSALEAIKLKLQKERPQKGD